MKRTVFVLLCLVALLAFPPLGVVADGSGESLLERLSAETTALTAKADAHAAVLAGGDRRMLGVLVGDPARFVAALDDVPEHGAAPKQGKVTLADGAEVEATLLDADGELGLAVYSLAGTRRAGLPLAGVGALKRGALAVSGVGGEPGLHVLSDVDGPLDDLELPRGAGTTLLAPGGALLGLSWRPMSGLVWNSTSCLTCHGGMAQTDARGAAAQLALTRRALQDRAVLVPGLRAETPLLGEVFSLDGMRSWQPLSSTVTHMPGSWQSSPGSTGGVVPAPVIERALTDVAQESGRFRRAYLGVVVDEQVARVAYNLVGAQGQLVLRYAPGAGDFVTTNGGVTWLPRIGLGGLGGTGQAPLRSAVRLSSVLPDSPAAQAGLKAGNEITAVDGRAFAGARGFARVLARRRPGEEVRLTVKDVAEPVKVLLVDREQEGRDLATSESVGLTVQALTPDLIAFLELPADTKGVVVRSVAEGSPAAIARIQRGDVFFTDDKDGAPIRDQGELDAILGAAQGSVILRGRRGQQNTVVNLELPTRVPARKTR